MPPEYLLIFKDTDPTICNTRAEAQEHFDEWPEDYQVIHIKDGGEWKDVTNDFREEYETSLADARAYDRDVRSTYYGSVL